MKNLILALSILVLTLMSIHVHADSLEHVPNVLARSPNTGQPDIWKKFIGENTWQDSDDVPDLIDFSYAGFKNGEEGIPEASGRIIDVTDHGAVPNDGRDDTNAINSALAAARTNDIVYFPAGKYDVFKDVDRGGQFIVNPTYPATAKDQIIIKGAGAQGAPRGTTIKRHSPLRNNFRFTFTTGWRANGSEVAVTGYHAKGTKSFTVENASSLIGKRFVGFKAENQTGDLFRQHVSKSRSSFPSSYTNIRNGIELSETHEIDRIEGNRVYVKAPLLTNVTPTFRAYSRDLAVGMGFEELHIEANVANNYVHLDYGHTGIGLQNTAHSYIRNCRFTNVDTGFGMGGSYASSVIGIRIDGRDGHYPGYSGNNTYCFIGLVEQHTDGKGIHGISSSASAGTVMWGIGGPSIHGPDTHGAQGRDSLWDNYRAYSHQAIGGALQNLPHHLDGYVRWNNVTKVWGGGNWYNEGKWGFKVTQAILIGYDVEGRPWPVNAYVEGFDRVVDPISLYVAQLERRLGYEPAWIQHAIRNYEVFTQKINGTYVGSPANNSPVIAGDETLTLTFPETHSESILHTFSATDQDGDSLSWYLTGEDKDSFKVHPSRGMLFSNAHLDFDYDTKAQYQLNVVVSDSKDTDSVAVTINITQASILDGRTSPANNSPVIAGDETLTLTFPETHSESILHTFSATDQDDDSLSWFLTGEDKDSFGVHPSRGMLFSNAHLDFDYDTKAQYQLNVVVSDSKDTDSVAVTINITQASVLDGRTDAVISAIVESLSNRETKFDVLTEDLANITSLDISESGLGSLKVNDFTGLTKLSELNLSHNRIRTLKSGMFSENTKLKRIRLNNNNLNSLPNDIFDPCILLERVFLAENHLSFIGQIFTNKQSIEIISLRNQKRYNLNTLTTLSNRTLKGLSNLKRLNLSDNGPIQIPIYFNVIGENGIRLNVPIGMPFTADIPILVNDVQYTTIPFSVGRVNSRTIIVEGEAGTSAEVQIGTLPALPRYHSGYTFKKGSSRKTITFPDVPAAPNLPVSTKLLNNFPNPFNPETWIPYQLAQKSFVNITIYNSRGVVVRQLLLGIQPAGFYRNKERAVYWDGKNSFGEPVATGIYFYQLNAGSLSVLKKMVILK